MGGGLVAPEELVGKIVWTNNAAIVRLAMTAAPPMSARTRLWGVTSSG